MEEEEEVVVVVKYNPLHQPSSSPTLSSSQTLSPTYLTTPRARAAATTVWKNSGPPHQIRRSRLGAVRRRRYEFPTPHGFLRSG